MENEENNNEAFWYKIEVTRCNGKGYEEGKRFELVMKFEPADMYELIKQIVNFSVSDKDWKASPVDSTPTPEIK